MKHNRGNFYSKMFMAALLGIMVTSCATHKINALTSETSAFQKNVALLQASINEALRRHPDDAGLRELQTALTVYKYTASEQKAEKILSLMATLKEEGLCDDFLVMPITRVLPGDTSYNTGVTGASAFAFLGGALFGWVKNRFTKNTRTGNNDRRVRLKTRQKYLERTPSTSRLRDSEERVDQFSTDIILLERKKKEAQEDCRTISCKIGGFKHKNELLKLAQELKEKNEAHLKITTLLIKTSKKRIQALQQYAEELRSSVVVLNTDDAKNDLEMVLKKQTAIAKLIANYAIQDLEGRRFVRNLNSLQEVYAKKQAVAREKDEPFGVLDAIRNKIIEIFDERRWAADCIDAARNAIRKTKVIQEETNIQLDRLISDTTDYEESDSGSDEEKSSSLLSGSDLDGELSLDSDSDEEESSSLSSDSDSDEELSNEESD